MTEQIQTDRLVIRALEDEELAEFLSVYLSNQEYLALVEGSGGEPGHYDLEMLQRDVALARLTPGRVVAGMRRKTSGDPVGILDWLDSNPSDGYPWIGLVLIDAARQRQGLGSEAVEGLLTETGWPAVRAGVIERNAAGLALVRRLGFAEIGSTEQKLTVGAERILLYERS